MRTITTETDSAIELLAARLRRSTVAVRTPYGGGSGVVWSRDRIVTNAHVVGARRNRVIFADGHDVRAEVVAFDRRRDLALLAIESTETSDPLDLRTTALKPGELVFAFGHPMGIENAIAMGVVYGVRRFRDGDFVIGDVRLARGNSGGPLVDASGALIGINSMVMDGFALAIPTTDVSAFAQAGTARRAA